jgi:HPt (histidine-containing phosphotransfer) domain-containing protein
MDPVAQQLRGRYFATFPEKKAIIEAALEAIPEHPGAKTDLRMLCHKLAGSAPMYNYDELGNAAREAIAAIDEALAPHILKMRIDAVVKLLTVN